jgi:hypothetical protein
MVKPLHCATLTYIKFPHMPTCRFPRYGKFGSLSAVAIARYTFRRPQPSLYDVPMSFAVEQSNCSSRHGDGELIAAGEAEEKGAGGVPPPPPHAERAINAINEGTTDKRLRATRA